jgi:predicted dehydrogenase
MKTVRYGILGFGLHGIRRLVPAYREAKQSGLVGIWRRDAAKAKQNGEELGIQHVFASAEELCASPDIDAVFVTSPDSLHCEHTLLALEHGKHVLCEKPLAMSATDVELMIAAADQRGLCFGAAQNFRYNPSSDRIRSWVGDGRIGAPRLAHCQFTFDAKTSARQWVYDPSLALGGPIGDVGSHCIDLLRFLLADEVTQVAAIAHGDAVSGPLEAGAALSLGFSRGTFAAVTVSFRGAYRTAVEISGETGQISAENGLSSDWTVPVTILRNGDAEVVESISNAGSYSRMLDGFAAWTQGGPQYRSHGRDALKTQQVLDSAYTSLKTGRTITL